MSEGRIEKINHRHEEEAAKKWAWWVNAVLMIVASALAVYLTRIIFTPDLFLLGPVELTGKILMPIIFFGFWVMFAHILALNSSTKMIWAASAVLGLTSFFTLTPIFALVAFPVLGVANALFLLTMRTEYHHRIKVSPMYNVERGVKILIDLTFILVALGVFILYGTALSQKGLQLPEPLLKNLLEESFKFAGAPVDLKPDITFGEVNEKVAEQITIPNVREQLVEQKLTDQEIEKYLSDHHQEILDQTKDQFFGKLGISGEYDQHFMDAVQSSLENVAKQNIPLPFEIALPGLLALTLFLLLHSVTFVFIWIGESFAWAWFHVGLWLRLVKIERRAEDIELIRF